MSQVDTDENFNVFLEDFSGAPDFQLQRTKFPFLDCDFPGDKDSHCDTIEKANWTHHCLIDTTHAPAVIGTIYDNFNLEMKNSGERVVAFEATETGGACAYYYFRRIEGKWYLIKRLSCANH